ncbi:hypothetical protein [Leptolyngbya sp. NIES-2104]|uniref:hypothetical protein n=1 Tax=Leptolyngbya sp. NIES-2104 TaxID=1552121 RepID=UPI0006EC91EF|nr:hypothetical protein [Leptolyngbya sp. NIES-2104]GAP94296.1 hypothetical protein NIES2104_08070 [Leptolyngbya sp. NIES-2104]
MAIRFAIIYNLVPEVIIVLMMVSAGIRMPSLLLLSSFFLISAFLLRFIWNSAILIHGLGHTLLTAIFDQDLYFITGKNILENRTSLDVLRSCAPFSSVFLPFIAKTNYPWVAAGRATSWRIRVKALGGILFNTFSLGFALLTAPFLVSFLSASDSTKAIVGQFLIQAFVGANLLVIISSLSDVIAVITGEATCFNCGNFGFLGKRLPQDGSELLPARVIDIFNTMGRETELRGEQAGGGVVLARDRAAQIEFVGAKVVNWKRQNLTHFLEAAFATERYRATCVGAKALDSAVVGVWHYRYATSSPPAILETHWHEWMPARYADVWSVEQGRWQYDRKNVSHRITHNGDFDGWMLFGGMIENAHLGLWLERVLHTPNATIGDSPKLAGMMDLLITQGMWDASFRLAYQLVVAESIEEAFGGKTPAKTAPNTAPSVSEIKNWVAIVEPIFLKHHEALLLPYGQSILDISKKHLRQFEQEVWQALSQSPLVSQWTVSKQADFVKTAIYSFFHNNVYQATKLLMSRAKGSFGLVVVSTLSETSLVLSAWGQPMVTGFNVQDEYMIYASEPAAVDAVLSDVPRAYRLDLDQKTGEIAWVGVNHITVYSMLEDRELLGSELEQRWIPLQGNAYILPPEADSKDPVERNLKEIPKVLKAIDVSWSDPTSFNRQSADNLAELLIAKANRWEYKHRATINLKLDNAPHQQSLDLLITGVESSLWVGEQFAQDLALLFPGLTIKTLSANQVLRRLQYDLEGLHLDNASIVLAISQSGQTFPTLQATNAFEELRRQGLIGELFILTGEVCSLMGSAIAQYYYQDSDFTRRIFVNCSGRRSAEPATVSIAATQATLTELLLYLAKRLRQRFSAQGAFGMTLTVAELLTLENLKREFIDRSVVAIIGATVDGESIHSPEHQQIVETGKKWALHILEAPLAWGIQALYVLITVGFQIPFVQTIFRWVFGLADSPVPASLLPLLTFADIFIYIFGAWFWTLGLRYFQGRPLRSRTGKRTLVIGDIAWVHQLLEAYVSKLFSLSYGIASLEVHSSDPQDHMLHHFGHRVVRGTLVLLGVPDGRRSQRRKEDESAVLMTGKQANGVRNFNSGADIVALGHNPAIAHQGFQNAIILPSPITVAPTSDQFRPQQIVLEELRESRFGSFERLLASYVFFWAMAKRVSSFPLLKYQHWKSQSRTRIMTTAAPVSRAAPNLLDRTVKQPSKR